MEYVLPHSNLPCLHDGDATYVLGPPFVPRHLTDREHDELLALAPAKRPRAVSHAWKNFELSDLWLEEHLTTVWLEAEMTEPDRWPLQLTDWLDLFHATGFTINGERARLPAKSTLVYRGCRKDDLRSMAWTTDLDLAEQWAHAAEQSLVPDHRAVRVDVWETRVHPRALLAAHDPHGVRTGRVLAVNPTGLRTSPVRW